MSDPYSAPFAALALLIAAPFAGSFAATLAVRLPAGRPVIFARSRCPHCDRPLAPLDLLPIASWLALRGRCRRCAAAIAPDYLLAEIAALALAAVALVMLPAGQAAVASGLGWALLALSLADYRSLVLPDALTLPLVAAGLAWAAATNGPALGDHAIGATAGWLTFYGLSVTYRRIRGREGLGGGDAKLAAAAGAWVGWAALPGVVLIAAATALAVALAGAATRRRLDPGEAVPFGLYLAPALWLVWLVQAAALLPAPPA